MPLHPQAVLAIQRAGDLPTDLSPADLRIAYERQRLTLLAPSPAVATTYQLSIPSDFGPSSSGRCTIWTPADPLKPVT